MFRNSQRIFIGGDIWSFEVKAGVNTKSFTKVKPRFTEGTTASCLSVSLCWWLLLMLSGGLLLVSCFVAAGVQDEGQGVLTYLPLITPPVIPPPSPCRSVCLSWVVVSFADLWSVAVFNLLFMFFSLLSTMELIHLLRPCDLENPLPVLDSRDVRN